MEVMSLRRALAAACLLSMAAAPALAHVGETDADLTGQPFTFNGHTWASQKDFIDSGSRCSRMRCVSTGCATASMSSMRTR